MSRNFWFAIMARKRELQDEQVEVLFERKRQRDEECNKLRAEIDRLTKRVKWLEIELSKAYSDPLDKRKWV